MNATPIPLKAKYRVGGKSRYKSGYGGNSQKAKTHRTLTAAEMEAHARQPEKVMVLGANGKRRMVTVRREP